MMKFNQKRKLLSLEKRSVSGLIVAVVVAISWQASAHNCAGRILEVSSRPYDVWASKQVLVSANHGSVKVFTWAESSFQLHSELIGLGGGTRNLDVLAKNGLTDGSLILLQAAYSVYVYELSFDTRMGSWSWKRIGVFTTKTARSTSARFVTISEEGEKVPGVLVAEPSGELSLFSLPQMRTHEYQSDLGSLPIGPHPTASFTFRLNSGDVLTSAAPIVESSGQLSVAVTTLFGTFGVVRKLQEEPQVERTQLSQEFPTGVILESSDSVVALFHNRIGPRLIAVPFSKETGQFGEGRPLRPSAPGLVPEEPGRTALVATPGRERALLTGVSQNGGSVLLTLGEEGRVITRTVSLETRNRILGLGDSHAIFYQGDTQLEVISLGSRP